MTDDDAWFADIDFHALAEAPNVIARFEADVSRNEPDKKDAGDAQKSLAQQVARAIVLMRLVTDDASLERLVQKVEEACARLQKAVLATHDPRDDPQVIADERLLARIRPVLAQCGHLLASRPSDHAGQTARELAEPLRKLLFDYELLGIKYGFRGGGPAPE
jgi:hypothetical protein